jgi:hypothetical protein
MDVTGKRVSPGNIASIAISPDTRFVRYTGDSSSAISSHWGASTNTSLTAAVDSFVYTGACGSQTNTGALYPISGINPGAGDGFITDSRGVGLANQNTNYNSAGDIVGYCATVGSTAGMSAGTVLFVAHSDAPTEFVKVLSVVNATNFTAFFHYPHVSGTSISFGGGVGNCIGADTNIIAAHTNDNGQNNIQTAVERSCYPIVSTAASGNTADVYINMASTASGNLVSRVPAQNTAPLPLTITAPVVTGGVLTGFTTNSTTNNYILPANGSAGHPLALPAPTVTVSGCMVAPVLGMTVTKIVGGTRTFIPTITSGGSGCGTVTFNIESAYPTPFGFYPVGQIYRAEDPAVANCAKTAPLCRIDGNPIMMPIVAGFTTGDFITMPQWWPGRQTPSGQIHLDGPTMAQTNATTFGGQTTEVSGMHNSASVYSATNGQPTASYFGSFANKFIPVDFGDSIVNAPTYDTLDGQFGIGRIFNLPPMLQTGSGVLNGGALTTVLCQLPAGFGSTLDSPCAHSIYVPFEMFNFALGGSSIPANMFYNPIYGSGGWTVGPWKVATLNVAGASTLSSATIGTAVVNSASFPNGATIGSAGSNATLTFENGVSQIQTTGLCSSGFLLPSSDLCDGVTNSTGLGVFAAAGVRWAGSFHSSLISTFNSIQSSVGVPLTFPSPVYSGTAGSIILFYAWQKATSLGVTQVGVANQVNGTSALGGSNIVTTPCPTSDTDVGDPAGVTYKLIRTTSGGLGGGGTGILLGTCAYGGNIVDNGSLTAVVSLPTISSTEPTYTGQEVISAPTGVAPLVVNSTTQVNNLNASLVGGHAFEFISFTTTAVASESVPLIA